MEYNPLKSLSERLNLEFQCGDLIAGCIRNFVVGIRVFTSGGVVHDPILHQEINVPNQFVGSIQICHLLAAPRNTIAVRWPPDIQQLVDSGKIRLSDDEKITWLTIFKLEEYAEVGPVVAILDDVLNSLEKAGIKGTANLCTDCVMRPGGVLSSADGRVSRLCSKCAEEKIAIARIADTTTPQARAALAYTIPVAILASALAWASIWFMYEWAVNIIAGGKKFIVVPGMVEMVVVGGIAAMAAAPIGFLFRRIPGLGITTAGRVGIFSCSLGLLLGELIFVYMTLQRHGTTLRLSTVPLAMVQSWWSSGAHSVIRALIAGIAVFLAFEFARSRPGAKQSS